MIHGKVEIAHENETAEGHGQVAHRDMGLGAVAGKCFSNHSDPQDVENNSKDAASHHDSNNPRDHGRGGRIPHGGRTVA